MALSINYGVQLQQQKLFQSFVRLYLNKEGRVCEETDPDVASLLCGAGQSIPWEQAVELGLVNGEDEQQVLEVSEVQPTAASKARKKGR